MRKDVLINAAVVVSVLCTAIVTGLVVRRELFSGSVSHPKPVAIGAADWDRLEKSGLRTGPGSALLTVVEFVDFECPACAAFYRTLRRFQSAHSDEVAVVLQHFPLEMHENALHLARVVECAAHRGRLVPLQDSIFSRQAFMSRRSAVELGVVAGIGDTLEFRACVSDSAQTVRVDSGIAIGRRLGVTATPTVIIDGIQYRQLVDSALLSSALEKARKGARQR